MQILRNENPLCLFCTWIQAPEGESCSMPSNAMSFEKTKLRAISAFKMVTHGLPLFMVKVREYLDIQGRSPFAKWFEDLTRIIHEASTAAADPGMSTSLRSVGFLDVLSSTPAESSRHAPRIHARLCRLATNHHE
jgi:hypothetical protein